MKNSRFKLQVDAIGGIRWADADKVFAHLMERYTKKQAKLQDNLEKRLEKFSKSLDDYIDDYDTELLEDFLEYWTEPNRSRTKMKFELQETWALSRRLKTWGRRKKGSKSTKRQHNLKKTDGRNWLAWCDKCLESSFYDPYNFNFDLTESICCNSKLLDEDRRDEARKDRK